MFALTAAHAALIYAVLGLSLAAFVALASRQAEGQRGFEEWAIASVSLAIAFPLNLVQEHLPLGFAIGVSNFLFMFGWCFLYYAIRTFFGRRHRHGLRCKWPWLLALGHGLWMTMLAVVIESVAGRLYWFNLAGALTLGAAALAVKPPRDGSLRVAALLMRGLLAAVALLHASRLLWFLAFGTPDTVVAPIAIQIVVAIVQCMLQIAMTFSFLLMQNFRLNDELREQADVDVLTGVFNRRGLDLRAHRLLARARKTRSRMAVIIMDIDHFKRVNDTHGHAVGDQVLCWLSAQLSALLRPNDLLGRYGGEEFVALLPDADLASAKKIAERMRSNIAAQAPEFDGARTPITLSLGIALAQDADYDLETALAQADANLYLAKESGRNQVCHLPPERQDGKLQVA